MSCLRKYDSPVLELPMARVGAGKAKGLPVDTTGDASIQLPLGCLWGVIGAGGIPQKVSARHTT